MLAVSWLAKSDHSLPSLGPTTLPHSLSHHIKPAQQQQPRNPNNPPNASLSILTSPAAFVAPGLAVALPVTIDAVPLNVFVPGPINSLLSVDVGLGSTAVLVKLPTAPSH
jgi:hypothetical protein